MNATGRRRAACPSRRPDPSIRAGSVVALEALGDGDQPGAVALLLALVEDGPVLARPCACGKPWPGLCAARRDRGTWARETVP